MDTNYLLKCNFNITHHTAVTKYCLILLSVCCRLVN